MGRKLGAATNAQPRLTLQNTRDTEVTRKFLSGLMFPKVVEQGYLDHGETAVYDRGDYSQAA
jgi:hypothetical protein